MFDQAIRDYCDRVKDSYSTPQTHDVHSEVLDIGNLFAYEKSKKITPETRKHIQKTLAEIKPKITSQTIRAWWEFIHGHQGTFKETQKSFNALKHGILRDRDFFQHLDTQALLSCPITEPFYREILIALIRCQLPVNEDPFSAFNYALLQQCGPEQNFIAISDLIKDCKQLPIDDLVLLVQKNPEYGHLLLLDCYQSSFYFDISGKLAANDSLRNEIVEGWQSLLANFPLREQERMTVRATLAELKLRYPAFAQVEVDSRIKRHYESHFDSLPINSRVLDFASLGALSSTAYLFSSHIGAHLASQVTGAALVSTVGPSMLAPAVWSMFATAPPAILPVLAVSAAAELARRWWFNSKGDDSVKMKPSAC